MGTAINKDYIEEAKKLLDIIDEKLITKKEDWIFFKSMEARVRVKGFVGEKQIFWLRDIKDRQLDKEN